MPPAYRILTERLLLRCYEPTDAPHFKDAVARSRGSLEQWMDVTQDSALAAYVARMRTFRAAFDRDLHYYYAVLTRAQGTYVGHAELVPDRGPRSFAIGGWAHGEHQAAKYGTEVGAALVKVAFEAHDAARVEMRCHPDHEIVRALATAVGYVHEATLRAYEVVHGQQQDRMIWALTRDAYPGTPAARTPLQAFDALDRRVL